MLFIVFIFKTITLASIYLPIYSSYDLLLYKETSEDIMLHK